MPYPLAALLDVRATEQKAAATALAAARDEEAQAARRLTAARVEEEKRRAVLVEERGKHEAAFAGAARTAADLQAAAVWLRGVQAHLDAARATVAEREKDAGNQAALVERSREALAEAVRALEVLEQHKGEWEAEQQAAAERKAEDELDELAARRRR